ncbi:MAG: hypothetical protein KatS3mg082_1804 [Nitrospiraceae bacterium]|nr:MAG: hypothetical protein KatS3mg082_1804 [Nitrospiraceae bacterium]
MSKDEFDHLNEDQLPENPKDIVGFIEAQAGKSAAPEDSEKEDAAEEKPESEEKPEQGEEQVDAKPESGEPEAQGEPPKEEKTVDGVLLKDGKRVIPYSVLAAERRRADEAERRAKEIEAKLAALEKPEEGDKEVSQKTVDDLREKLAELKEAVPEVGEVLEKLTLRYEERIQALQNKLDEMAKREETREEREEREAQSRVQEAIDRNAVLRYLQHAEDKRDLWDEAVRIDKMLRENPRYADLTLDERFQKVVAMLQAEVGTIEVPAEFRDPVQEKTQNQGRAKGKPKDVEKPITLSDLPGGAPPLSDSKRLENMTAAEIDELVEKIRERGGSIQDLMALFG